MFGNKTEEEEKPREIKCQWCGATMVGGSYPAQINEWNSFFVLKGNIGKPFWFDNKRCLAYWAKGLVEAEKA